MHLDTEKLSDSELWGPNGYCRRFDGINHPELKRAMVYVPDRATPECSSFMGVVFCPFCGISLEGTDE